MTYYAYLKQKGDGCDYTIGCGNTLIDFEADSDNEAKEKLKQIISQQYTGDSELEKAIIFRDKIDFNVDKVYDNLKKLAENERNRMMYLKDKEEYDRLKKKFGY